MIDTETSSSPIIIAGLVAIGLHNELTREAGEPAADALTPPPAMAVTLVLQDPETDGQHVTLQPPSGFVSFPEL